MDSRGPAPTLDSWQSGKGVGKGWGRVGVVGAQPPKASKKYKRVGSHCRLPQGPQVSRGEGLLPRCLD